MKPKILIFLLLCTLTSAAQKKEYVAGSYRAYLCSAEGPNQFAAGIIDTLLETYEDSLIKITWLCADSKIEFNMMNKIDQTIKVIWDDAAFISIYNESSKVFHNGIKYIDRENAQPSTSVYKKTTLTDLVLPTTYVYYQSGQYGGWRSKPLIPYEMNGWFTKVVYDENLIGKTMRVVLPLKVADVTYEYSFSFRTYFTPKNNK